MYGKVDYKLTSANILNDFIQTLEAKSYGDSAKSGGA